MNNITPIKPINPSVADFGYGHELHSEILPGLWQGGTHDEDVITAGYALRRITNHEFETVVTLYARAMLRAGTSKRFATASMTAT